MQITSRSTSLPVTLAQAKQECDVTADDTSHDATIINKMHAALEWVERETQRSLVETEYLDILPTLTLYRVPRPPLRSISIQYYPTGSDELTTLVSGTDYLLTVSTYHESIIRMNRGITGACRGDAFQVTYTAGYTTQTFPYSLKEAIYKKTRFLFLAEEKPQETAGLDRLLAPYMTGANV